MQYHLTNKQWIYHERPTGRVAQNHYQFRESTLEGVLSRGEVLIAARYISVDPYMRIQQAAGNTWEAPHPLGAVQGSAAVAQVMRSNDPSFQPGDWVQSYSGWQTHAVVHASELTKLDPSVAPVTTALHVLGMPGRTAWFGLMEAGRPKPGETVLVSGATGAVGSIVVQFAKKAGCKVIGTVSSEAKGRYLTEVLGADHALEYKGKTYQQILNELAALSSGIDVYFDNTGGAITDAAINHLALRARVIICGQMSQYEGGLDTPELGPRLLHHFLYKRATMQGILARDFTHRMPEMISYVAPWVRDGQFHYQESFIEGFMQLPNALSSLFKSQNTGKVIVTVEQ